MAFRVASTSRERAEVVSRRCPFRTGQGQHGRLGRVDGHPARVPVRGGPDEAARGSRPVVRGRGRDDALGDDDGPGPRSPRLEVLRRLHVVAGTRGHRTMPGVVSLSILSLWKTSGPSRRVGETAFMKMACGGSHRRGRRNDEDAMPHESLHVSGVHRGSFATVSINTGPSFDVRGLPLHPQPKKTRI